MSLLRMAWRNLSSRGLQTAITSLAVGIGVALALAIVMLSGGIKEGIARATEPFGLIVGSKGSANQLVFNTIFMMDNPLANMPLPYYESLAQDPRVAQAVPFALGDNYKGYRIVGTSAAFFQLKARPADPPYFRLASGVLFKQPFEAVIGAKVARDTGLRIGDTFVSGHGVSRAVEADEHKEHPFTVTGILQQIAAPADQGIYVSLDSYWISHEHGEDHHEAAADAPPSALTEPGHDDDLAHGVTAALLKPKSYMDLMRLYQEINQTKEAQAVFPGQVVAKLFDMMGSGELLLKYISYVVLAMAGLTVVLALYGSTLERRRTVAILRAIGAGRGEVVAIALLESALIVLLGCAGGTALGFAATYALSAYIGSQLSISVVVPLQWELLTTVAGIAALGMLSGLVTAIGAYRTETSRYLNAM